MTAGTKMLRQAGVSIWLDDLSRNRLQSGNLKALIETHDVVGVTTNPSIFSASISSDSSYDAAIELSRTQGRNATDIVTQLTVEDVREACDLLHQVFIETNGVDGRVSIEVEPALARNPEGTVARAKELWDLIDRPNVMVKIPATEEGLTAISDTLALGISVNVTLIFSLPRYRQVINAYLSGLERAREAGQDISTIHSVASFFISRLDSAVDPHFDSSDSEDTQALAGRVAIANASEAYQVFEEQFNTVRAQYLQRLGAHRQRLLWASTGVKESRFPADLYVTELVAPDTVNTMPEATLQAAADIASVDPHALAEHRRDSRQILALLPAVGLRYDEVTEQLEREGLLKFEEAWDSLLETVTARLQRNS